MDPTLAAAFTKLVVGAAGSVGSKIAGLLWNAAGRDRRVLSYPHAKVDLQAIENELVTISLTEVTLHASSASIYDFVTSPVLATLTEQLILVSFAGTRPSLEIAIRGEFRASCVAYFDEAVDERSRISDADKIFDVLSQLTEIAVLRLKKDGYKLTEEALQRMHYVILEMFTSSIERNTRLLSGLRTEGRERNNDFLNRLSAQVAFRYRNIEPPDFDRIVRIPIEDMYVSPSFSEGIQPGRYAIVDLNLPNFASRIYRTVVLGDPGGGKSTLSAFLAHEIGSGKLRQDIFRDKTPLIIVLRDIQMSERGPESILQYIEAICETSFALRPPANAIEYALLNGYLLLIFDGLDELLEPSNRGKVVEAIEAIANLYPGTSILVTSRRINYEAAPLDSRIFAAYTLNEFNDRRIEEYSYKYFKQLDDRSDEEVEGIAAAFLRESRDHAAEIRSNPLMLALMCRLYRGINYIPQNLPALYQRCANMLFFTWDERRHIGPGVPFEYHVEPLMAHLGYWIFISGETAVSEGDVVRHAEEYLQEWLISDSREAEAAAVSFVKYLKNRLWVFTEVGLTDEGEGLYSFTHRTFLEYFTGMYLSTHAASNVGLAQDLTPRLRSSEWDVVAQIAIYLRSKSEVRAADEIIQSLLQVTAPDTKRASSFLIYFVTRLLAFVVPRPETLTQIVYAALNTAISFEEDESQASDASRRLLLDEDEDEDEDDRLLARLVRRRQLLDEERSDYESLDEDRLEAQLPILVSLARARADNRLGITRGIVNYVESICDGPKARVINTVGPILQLPGTLSASSGDAAYISDIVVFWESVADAILTAVGESIREWAAADEDLAMQAWRAGVLNLQDLVSIRGAAVVFERNPYWSSERQSDDAVTQSIAIFPDVLVLVANTGVGFVRALEEWHDIAISLPTPWFNVRWLAEGPFFGPSMLYDYGGSEFAFSSLVFMVAAFWEAGAANEIEGSSLGDLDGFKDVFRARAEVPNAETVDRRLRPVAELVTADCVELLRKWAMNQLDFCFTS